MNNASPQAQKHLDSDELLSAFEEIITNKPHNRHLESCMECAQKFRELISPVINPNLIDSNLIQQ